MSTLSKKLVEALSKKFNLDLLEQTKFWEKPLSLKLLNETALKKLQDFIDRLSIDNFISSSLNDIKTALKKDPVTNKILNLSDNLLNEEIISDLLRKCQNITEDNVEDLLEKIEKLEFNNNYLKTIEETNDLFEKIQSVSDEFINTTISYVSIALMVFYIGRLLIEAFTQSDFPSIFRLKYIQKLIRVTLSSISNIGSDQFNNLKGFLKTMDVLSIAIGLASAVYLYNLNRSQKIAEDELNETLCPELKEKINIPISPIIRTPFEITLSCPKNENEDDSIVPKEPYEIKLKNISTVCDIPAIETESELKADLAKEIAVYAIIENQREKPMIPTVSIDSKVTDETQIATLEGHPVYSPTNGYITSLLHNKIVLSDISDNPENYLTRSMLLLNDKYTELNNIKTFLKKWEVISLYPVMMKNSPETDGKWTLQEIATKIYDSMDKQFDKIKKDWEKINKNYEKNIKQITGKDNIKYHGENETLHIIKEEIDKEEELVNKYLRTVETGAINIAKVTDPKSNEFELIEYYIFELGIELNAIKELSDIEKSYRDQINIFTEQRFLLDGFSPDKIGGKIQELLKKLEKGITLKNLFSIGVEKYLEKKKLSDVEDWVQSVADKNKKLEDFEKEQLVLKIMYLYNFYFNIGGIIQKYTPDPSTNQVDPSINKIELDNKQQVIKEGNYISNFFGNLWKRYIKLPDEIKEIEEIIEDLSIFSPYTLVKDPSTFEESRLYTIASETTKCEPPGGFTEADFSDIKYWLKYCTFATLASVANPISGWSTGFILPTGPLLLPTVYIPIKPIQTQYGFILLGLTITGVWVFPLILMVNYSTEYAMPILDPTIVLKNQLEELKKNINEQLKELKGSVLKKYMEKKNQEIKEKEKEISGLIKKINDHKFIRPAKTSKNLKEYNEWEETLNEIKKPELELKLEKFKLEKQHKIVYDAYSAGIKTEKSDIVDAPLKTIQASEELIDKQFEKFDTIIDKMNAIVAPLPTTLKMNSANFGFTLKKPQPVINIAKELDDNVNEAPLQQINNRFKLKNEDFMKGPVVFNSAGFNTALNIAGLSLIKKDPFPAYEKLKITNLPWIKFLGTDFVPTGAKCYGIPGFP